MQRGKDRQRRSFYDAAIKKEKGLYSRVGLLSHQHFEYEHGK